jgi:hypothetical protein
MNKKHLINKKLKELKKRSLNIEALSIDEAKQILKSRIPKDYYVTSEEVLSEGEHHVIQAKNENLTDATLQAESQIPPGFKFVIKDALSKPGERTTEIRANNEQEAVILANKDALPHGSVISVDLKETGSRGFLGFGHKPNLYLAIIRDLAVVEIRAAEQSKFRFYIRQLPSEQDLLSWAEALSEETSERCRAQIQSAVTGRRPTPEYPIFFKRVSEELDELLCATKALYTSNKGIHKLRSICLEQDKRWQEVELHGRACDIELIIKKQQGVA